MATTVVLNSSTIVIQDAPTPQPITENTLVVIGSKMGSANHRPVMLKNKDDITVGIRCQTRPLTGEENMQNRVREDYAPNTEHGQAYAVFLQQAELMNPALKGQIMPEYNLA
jgi:hypothetical protein